MAAAQQERAFFHESWYRIAGERLSLRSSVRARRQLFRGERWYVLHEPFGDQFFRLRPPAYEFVSRLDCGRTVDEVWRDTIDRDPENAPGQEEVIQLLSQLYYANLLHYDLPPDSEKLFERYKERRQATRRATLRTIMFFRVPLFDPNATLKRLEPVIKLIASPLGAIVWIATVVAAVAVVANHFGQLRIQTQGILSLSNLPLLYLSLIIIKALHELGHASAVRRFGGSVHTMGIMFLIFNPLPYTDTTASWSFRSKWHRVLVGLAGMVTEVFVAALAVFVWAGTGTGPPHALAYNMMIVASVSTVVFNLNPLMRFDGYYILSDVLDIPNLNARASRHLRHLIERYAFGFKRSESPASSRSEAAWLTLFGIASGLYRLAVFSTILLIIADRFLLLGIVVAAVCAIAWVLTPLLRLVNYLATSPRLERTRLRAAGVCLLFAALLVGLLAVLPLPSAFKAPGVLEASRLEIVANDVAGRVVSIEVTPGTRVNKGDVLVHLANPELTFQAEEVQAHLNEAEVLEARAINGNPADLQAIESTAASIRKQLERIRREQADLLVKAAERGIWVAPDVHELSGSWIQRGTQLGKVVDDSSFYFASVISEENASSIFSGSIRRSEVRLAGDPGCSLPVNAMTRIPVERTQLPSAALGFQGGGSLATSPTSAEVASLPFYELRLLISGCPKSPQLQGMSGQVRFQLAPEPILIQAYRKVRQLIQARYQI